MYKWGALTAFVFALLFAPKAASANNDFCTDVEHCKSKCEVYYIVCTKKLDPFWEKKGMAKICIVDKDGVEHKFNGRMFPKEVVEEVADRLNSNCRRF